MSLSSRMPDMLGEVALRRKSFLPKRFKQDFAAMPRTTPEPQGEVGKNLRALIGDDSVNAWSNRHKLSQTTINRIVTGKMDPTMSTLERIADAVGVESWRLVAPNMGYTALRFDALSAYESNLVTAFRQLPPEDQRTLLINVNERVRAANIHPPMDEAGTARGDVTFDREHKNATESNQWQSTKPITKTDVSTGRASPVLRDTEDKDHPKRQPAHRKGVRS